MNNNYIEYLVGHSAIILEIRANSNQKSPAILETLKVDVEGRR
jgi:hypothetical protein